MSQEVEEGFFLPLQFEPLNTIKCQDGDLQNPWDFDFFLLGGEKP